MVEEVAQQPSRDQVSRSSQRALVTSQPRLARSRDRRCAPSSTTAAPLARCARHASLGYGSLEDGEVIRAALLPQTRPAPALDPDDPTCETQTDPRDHGARMWDALVATAQHALDTDLPPQTHGARPRIAVTTSLDHLKQALAKTRGESCPTETGLELSVAAVRRLACDADIIPGVLGTDGQVLDVGRAHRLVTMAIWIALILRDQHCAFPGCTRPPLMCHAHHITHWADGGETSLANLTSC